MRQLPLMTINPMQPADLPHKKTRKRIFLEQMGFVAQSPPKTAFP